MNDFVDYFVIVESKFTHRGEKRDLKFNHEKFKKFKNKIIYLIYDKEPTQIEIVKPEDNEMEKSGKYILNALLNKQYNIYAFSRPQSTRKISHIKNINIISGRIEDEKSIKKILTDCSCVIYNIGIIREFKSQGITYQKLHFDYTKLIIDQAKKYNIEHFILMSANGVKNQGTGYQSTK